MAYDYDKLYGETPDALGPPTPVFVRFFDALDRPACRVLDIGCGQGRDALFIARRGHEVLGVDQSPNGIRDLEATAKTEGLPITGIVADITTFRPEGYFDVIVIDRTLHMLPKALRLAVLARLLDHVEEAGWVLIADEASNIASFRATIAAHRATWQETEITHGYLFVQRG